MKNRDFIRACRKTGVRVLEFKNGTLLVTEKFFAEGAPIRSNSRFFRSNRKFKRFVDKIFK